MHGYNCTMRRSVFPSEDHCGGGQISESHGSSSGSVSQSSSAGGGGGGGGANGGTSPQQLKWQAHQVETWHDLCDGALQDM